MMDRSQLLDRKGYPDTVPIAENMSFTALAGALMLRYQTYRYAISLESTIVVINILFFTLMI